MVCMRSVSWFNGKSVCFQRLGCISSLALYQNLFLGLFPKNTGILQIDEYATSCIPLSSPEGWLLTQAASLYTSSYRDKGGACVWCRTGEFPKGGNVLVGQTHTSPLCLPIWGEVVCKLGVGFIWMKKIVLCPIRSSWRFALQMIHCNYLQSEPLRWKSSCPWQEQITNLFLPRPDTWGQSQLPTPLSPDLENSLHSGIMELPIPRAEILICLVRSTQIDFFVKELLRKLISSNNYTASTGHSLRRMTQ